MDTPTERIEALETPATLEETKALLTAIATQQADLKQVKELIFKVLGYIGFLNDDGTFRERINMKKVFSVAMMATTNSKQLEKEMSFIKEFIPLLEKYKDL